MFFSRNFCLALIFYAITFFNLSSAQEIDTLWKEGFEEDWAQDWHVEAGTWEIGLPTSGPNSAFKDSNCAATVLGGHYSDGVSTRLIRHTSFVVPDSSQNPYLRFYHWFNLHAADYFQVQIKVDGQEWEELGVKYAAVHGSSAWSPGIAFLHSYAGKSVTISFYFYSANAGGGSPDTHYGCYIDEVSVVSGATHFNNPENWLSGVQHWGAEYGSWECGVPKAGPSEAHSDSVCIGTNLKGNYQDPARSRFISMPITISPVSSNPALTFWHWFSFNAADYGQVQVRKFAGGEWQDLENGKYVSTSSGIWSNTYFPLDEFSGKTIQIGFFFYSANAGGGSVDVSTGWYIDDIEVNGVVTGVEQSETITPIDVILGQNYPNPFNPLTTIPFYVQKAGQIKVSIYNSLGQKVADVVDANLTAGYHEEVFDGRELSSGVYYYRMDAEDFVRFKKMLLLK